MKQSKLSADLLLLNKRIAEEFLGHKVEEREVLVYGAEGGDFTVSRTQMRTEVFDDGSGEAWEDLPNFSSDMGQAWSLVEKLAKLDVQVRISNKVQGNDFWWCYMTHPDNPKTICCQALTAPEAICEAVLQIKDVIKK